MTLPPVHPFPAAPPDIGSVTEINSTPAVPGVPAPSESAIVATDGNASIVDISNLGGVLSASAELQSAETGATPAFSDVARTAQSFVDAFNNFQSSAIFSEQLPLTAETAFTGSINANLAALGFQQQDNTESGNVRFTLNLQSLQTSFQANPAQTAALLAQTIQILGTTATKVAGQNQAAQSIQPAGTEADAANADAQLQLQQSLANVALEQAIAESSTSNAATPATPATPATLAPAATGAASANANAPVPPNIPPTPLNNAVELASDPSVAAAVAAYRLGIRTTSRTGNSVRTPEETVTAVAAVPHIEPVALDPHRK